jgi:RNA polymerase sigma-70 factor, ECF subfamily
MARLTQPPLAQASAPAELHDALPLVGVGIGIGISGGVGTSADRQDIERAHQLALWLHEAAQGSATAFEAFYEATSRPALALIRRVIGSDWAEDVLAETFIQAWTDAKRFDAARGNAFAWLLTMARSRALDRLRAERVRHGGLAAAPEQIDDDALGAEAGLAALSVETSPETLLVHTQTASMVQRALADLSAHERWVIALAYYQDLSHSEIAKRTGLPLGTVKSHAARGQAKLRNALAAHRIHF